MSQKRCSDYIHPPPGTLGGHDASPLGANYNACRPRNVVRSLLRNQLCIHSLVVDPSSMCLGPRPSNRERVVVRVMANCYFAHNFLRFPPCYHSSMRHFVVLFIHFIATLARLLGPGGVRSLVAEALLLK